jgi:hypothetical protein
MSTRNIAEALRSPAQASEGASRVQKVLSQLALFVLCAVAVLAFAPTVQPTFADRVTLFLLAIAAGVCFWTPALRFFEERTEAATFAVTLTMFLIYGLARQSLPNSGWTLRTALLPDTPQVMPLAGLFVFAGAVFTSPLWWSHRNSWTRTLILSIGLVALLGISSFWFLGRYYTVGETEILDPTPLVQLMLQSVEFASVALLCSAACALPGTRRLLLRLLPLMLLVLWARYQFFPAPKAEETE